MQNESFTSRKQPANTMKNADRPFLLLIFIAITLLYTVMAFIS